MDIKNRPENNNTNNTAGEPRHDVAPSGNSAAGTSVTPASPGAPARPAQTHNTGASANAPTQNIALSGVASTVESQADNEKTREMPEGALSIESASVEKPMDKKKKSKKKKTRDDKEAEYTEANNSVMSLIKCMAYIAVVLAVSTIISVCVIFAANDIFAFVKSDDVMEIEIPEGADFDDIADILHDNKIINYKFLFKMYMGGKVEGVTFAPGTYSLSPMTSYSDLVYTLREKAPTGISYITIPEGYTTDEIIDLLVSKGIGSRERYVDVINNYDFDYWFIDELGEDWEQSGRFYRLDGYLFPDSYQFYNASSEETVINKFLARFDAVFTKNYRNSASELGYTVDQILIIASMIEKEGGAQAEFGFVSSVFHNRLKSPDFPCMESDATIAYAIHHDTGTRPVLTGEDLDYDSPYNSYKNPGLSPGPIANPSNSAILSALNPTPSNYYFFVSDGQTTYFASTKWEHDQNIAMIQNRNNAE